MGKLILFFSVLVSPFAFSQDSTRTLESELTRLKTKTALLVNSQAIDEYPMWSPKSDYIGYNKMGKWYKLKLTGLSLEEATWHGATIGLISGGETSTLSSEEKKEFEKVSVFNAREVTTKDGTKIELKEKGFSVALVITKKGKKSKTLWTTGGENCHSLVLSPDEKYVAYLCEMNGVIVMKIK